MNHFTWLLGIFGLTLISTCTSPKKSFKTLDYLYTISGKYTVAGQHNKEPNAIPDKWTNEIYRITGKYPGLWSGDFLFQEENIENRRIMIDEAKRQWENGAIINLMWHACNPAFDEPCGWDSVGIMSHLSDEQWNELITEGPLLNGSWKRRMDKVSVYLQELEDAGVEVLFRPLHEMNQGAFWWGGRKGPKGTAELYRITHDYFTITKGLNNLIWIWDMQDLSRDFADYNPGEGYWDVFGFDVYDKGYDPSWYADILKVVGNKPIAIGECAKLPSPGTLVSQPRWTFFMVWAELVVETNTTDEIKNTYKAPQVLTRDELPGWE
jgi:mannan endo-1,4-beta-mannosidase